MASKFIVKTAWFISSFWLGYVDDIHTLLMASEYGIFKQRIRFSLAYLCVLHPKASH